MFSFIFKKNNSAPWILFFWCHVAFLTRIAIYLTKPKKSLMQKKSFSRTLGIWPSICKELTISFLALHFLLILQFFVKCFTQIFCIIPRVLSLITTKRAPFFAFFRGQNDFSGTRVLTTHNINRSFRKPKYNLDILGKQLYAMPCASN